MLKDICKVPLSFSSPAQDLWCFEHQKVIQRPPDIKSNLRIRCVYTLLGVNIILITSYELKQAYKIQAMETIKEHKEEDEDRCIPNPHRIAGISFLVTSFHFLVIFTLFLISIKIKVPKTPSP